MFTCRANWCWVNRYRQTHIQCHKTVLSQVGIVGVPPFDIFSTLYSSLCHKEHDIWIKTLLLLVGLIIENECVCEEWHLKHIRQLLTQGYFKNYFIVFLELHKKEKHFSTSTYTSRLLWTSLCICANQIYKPQCSEIFAHRQWSFKSFCPLTAPDIFGDVLMPLRLYSPANADRWRYTSK